MSYLLLAPGKQRKRPKSPFHVWIIGKDERWLEFYRLDTGFLLRFPGLADFTMTDAGTDITCRPVTGVSAATIEHLYLNQILPLAQNAAGALSFHGSAVVIEDFAIAFLGPSGRGKSTLAASFAVKGQAFLTDDGLITEERNGTYHILPSHPSIRLWDDSQEELLAPEFGAHPSGELHPEVAVSCKRGPCLLRREHALPGRLFPWRRRRRRCRHPAIERVRTAGPAPEQFLPARHRKPCGPEPGL